METDEDEVVCQQKKCHSPLGLYKPCKTSVKNSTGNIDVCEASLKVGIDYINSNCSTINDCRINIIKGIHLGRNSDCEL